jgi:signal transduction histidine kinase
MVEVERFARAQRNRIEQLLPPSEFVHFEPLQVDPDLVAETEKRLIINVLLINGVILVFSGLLSYFLAGKTLRPIKEMVEEQDRFISDSSHEFRTPLTSLKSAMEVALMDKKLSLSEAKKLISENIEDVNRLQKLSDSLIQLSRRGGKIKLNIEKISVKSLIESSLHQVKSLANKKDIDIKSSSKNINFLGDKDKLTNLMVILLDNAIKYSQNKKRVILKVWKTKHFVNISVKDYGYGISDKDLPNIYDRFYRADLSRSSTKVSGHGLGLSIAKMIVDQHKGRISVKSKLGSGTIFVVRIPQDIARYQ